MLCTHRLGTRLYLRFLWNILQFQLEFRSTHNQSADLSKMVLKLYVTEASPPTLAVRMGLAYLKLNPELINVDLNKNEHRSPEFLKKNPTGEVPCLDDDGLIVSESVAILQYIADKYKVDDTFYPSDPKRRAIVNQRLAFYNATYYKASLDYWIFPMFLGSPKVEWNLKRLERALDTFNNILKDSGSYAAGNNLTIADLSLIMGTVSLDCIDFDLKPYPHLLAWYKRFQEKHPNLWELANKEGLVMLKEFVKNPPLQSTF